MTPGTVSVTTNLACVPEHRGPLDFVFVVHPRAIEDVFRVYPHLDPRDGAAAMAAVRRFPVSVASPITVTCGGRRLHGELVSIPYLPAEFRRRIRPIRAALREVMAYASSRGARVVGLGALIPSRTRYGADLAPFAQGMTVTTGHAFTAHALARHVWALEALWGDPRTVAIVGAAGSIGSGTARALAGRPRGQTVTLIDVAARLGAVERLRQEMIAAGCRRIEISSCLESIRDAAVVVCATNAPTAIIRPSDLAPGCIVIDDSQPPNITLETAWEAKAVVIKCLAAVPAVDCPFDYGLFPPEERAGREGVIFTCLAETIMLAADGGATGFDVGSPGPGPLSAIAALAEKFGVTIAPFQSFPEVGGLTWDPARRRFAARDPDPIDAGDRDLRRSGGAMPP
jgi:predicted amino acid dehydrogenase